MNQGSFSFQDLPASAFSDARSSSARSAPGDFQLLDVSSNYVASSPFSDALSALADAAGEACATRLAALLVETPVTKWRDIASCVAQLVASKATSEEYSYVPKADRNRSVVTARPLADTATLVQSKIAANLHGLSSTQALIDGWKFGARREGAVANGGYPIYSEFDAAREAYTDFVATEHVTVIGGITNPIPNHEYVIHKKNAAGMIALGNPLFMEKVKENRERNAHTISRAGDVATKLYGAPAHVTDSFAANKEGTLNLLAAICHWRVAAREALKVGRSARKTDNGAVVCSPWYRYAHAPKHVNRLAFILQVTGGKIASTTSKQIGDAFSTAPDGWHVYMDYTFTTFPDLLAKLTSSNHVKDNVLAAKVLVQVNVTVDDAKMTNQAFAYFAAENAAIFGWAIHDGHLFFYRGKSNVHQIPKMLATCAAVNNVRTLQTQAPFLDVCARDFLDKCYGVITAENVLLPVGVLTGIDNFDLTNQLKAARTDNTGE